TQAGWPATPARGRGPGGQDCPTGCGRAAERDLRGGLPRHLVRATPRPESVIGAAKRRGRNGARDAAPMLTAYREPIRLTERATTGRRIDRVIMQRRRSTTSGVTTSTSPRSS